ncbi:aminotransferase class I/II-fold pyridoxal phosphate-dependent enzyme [Lacunimicrobium album]
MPNRPRAWLSERVSRLREDGLYRARRVVESLTARESRFEDGRVVIDFASNDYLGLAHHPDVVAAAKNAADAYGVGARASPLISGLTPAHTQLIQALCDFEGAEAALLFSSGYAANVGVLSALAGPEDVIYSDRLNHACLIDGAKLSGARFRVYRHGELDRLQKELANAGEFRRRFIVTDGVFSMDGDLAPLKELVDLAEKYDAEVIVDEAHGTGVYGPNLRGACDHFVVSDRVLAKVGTLSKAIGGQGAFVVGSRELIDYLWNSARTQMFSTALSPVLCAAATASLRIIRSDNERQRRLRNNVHQLRDALHSLALTVLGDRDSPIVPIILQSPTLALQRHQALLDEGFLVGCVRPPTVPAGTSRLRMTVNAEHTTDDIERLAMMLKGLLCT